MSGVITSARSCYNPHTLGGFLGFISRYEHFRCRNRTSQNDLSPAKFTGRSHGGHSMSGWPPWGSHEAAGLRVYNTALSLLLLRHDFSVYSSQPDLYFSALASWEAYSASCIEFGISMVGGFTKSAKHIRILSINVPSLGCLWHHWRNVVRVWH